MKIYRLENSRNDKFDMHWHECMHYVDRVPTPCPSDPRHINCERSRPLHFVAKKQAISDIMWVSYECVISRHAYDVLSSSGVTGLQYEIAIAHASGHSKELMRDLDPVRSIRPAGWGGFARGDSGVRMLEKCEGCGRQVFTRVADWSKVFDVGSWDGSDVFMIWPMVNSIFVTERVVSVLIRHELKHVKCTPIERLELHDFGFAIGPMSQYMTDDLAQSRGSPMGLYWRQLIA